MTPDRYLAHLRGTLDQIRADGFYKTERVIRTPQMPALVLAGGAAVVNFCANNYLGLADDPELVAAARDGLDRYGYGMASVRFICGTQSVHRELEAALSAFLDTGDAILYSSCFDANGGLFETLLGRRGRRHQRRAEPREHRRRHQALQGAPLPVPQQRHGGSRRAACRKRMPPAHASS